MVDAPPYLNDVPNEDLGKFSPDGKWIAYISDEAGSNDVYIRSFPVPDHKYRVTTDGGTVPPGAIAFDTSPDLQRFLVAIPAGGNSGLSLMVVNDWLGAIR